MLRFSRPPRIIRIFVLSFFAFALIAPVPYVAIMPGEAQKVLPKIVKISNSAITTYPADGQLYLMSIYITNPDTYVTGAETLAHWINGDHVVVPKSVVYPEKVSAVAEEKRANREMKGSQSTAKVAALRYLQNTYEDRGYDQITSEDISFSVKNTGGPSGGLIFSLAVVELLTEEDILQGREVAGTGTISENGTVGFIGGIREKIIAAQQNGATIFFAPKVNCSEVTHIPEGITVIGVTNLSDALAALETPKRVVYRSDSGCASVGA